MKNKKGLRKTMGAVIALLVALGMLLSGCAAPAEKPANKETAVASQTASVSKETEPSTKETESSNTESANKETEPARDDTAQMDSIPDYAGQAFVVINDNQPKFDKEEITTKAFEYFSELDELERCGMTMACVGKELMPTEDRESISHIKPSGWVKAEYDFVDGKYLYNRCHLIGFQLTGENANDRNLITGTRYLNVEGMLPFENMVADYVKETENHVMYRVTPIFEGTELVARGVQMEALSVEDKGQGIQFNVYVYNVQPGVVIDYRTGESREGEPTEAPKEEVGEEKNENETESEQTYILNVSSKKFHLADCSGAEKISKKNKQEYYGTRTELEEKGFEPCGQCKP